MSFKTQTRLNERILETRATQRMEISRATRLRDDRLSVESARRITKTVSETLENPRGGRIADKPSIRLPARRVLQLSRLLAPWQSISRLQSTGNDVTLSRYLVLADGLDVRPFLATPLVANATPSSSSSSSSSSSERVRCAKTFRHVRRIAWRVKGREKGSVSRHPPMSTCRCRFHHEMEEEAFLRQSGIFSVDGLWLSWQVPSLARGASS